jgi:hypothetical protein
MLRVTVVYDDEPESVGLEQRFAVSPQAPCDVPSGGSRASCSATPRRLQRLCLDRGHDYNEVRELGQESGCTAHIRGRGEEARAIKHEAGFRARR